MFRVDSLAHGGSGNAYARSSGIGERALLCSFSICPSIHLMLARGETGKNEYMKENWKRRF